MINMFIIYYISASATMLKCMAGLFNLNMKKFNEFFLHLFVSCNPDNGCDGYCHEYGEAGTSEVEDIQEGGDEADEQHQQVKQAEGHEASAEGDELCVMIDSMGRVVRRLHLLNQCGHKLPHLTKYIKDIWFLENEMKLNIIWKLKIHKTRIFTISNFAYSEL